MKCVALFFLKPINTRKPRSRIQPCSNRCSFNLWHLRIAHEMNTLSTSMCVGVLDRQCLYVCVPIGYPLLGQVGVLDSCLTIYLAKTPFILCGARLYPGHKVQCDTSPGRTTYLAQPAGVYRGLGQVGNRWSTGIRWGRLVLTAGGCDWERPSAAVQSAVRWGCPNATAKGAVLFGCPSACVGYILPDLALPRQCCYECTVGHATTHRYCKLVGSY